jgi:hypothetical protein
MFKNPGSNLGALLLLVAIGPLQAAQALKDRGDAATVLARYVASGRRADWTIESIDVDASLPKLAKGAQLQAIRRLLPNHQKKYEVLQLTGDRTVKEQVIARYLSAEQRASEIAAVSVAITPANYKFSYKAVARDANRVIYVFEIAPRKRREGLIKGELWLDGGSAAPLLYSGRLVRTPSVFIKSIAVTQESIVRDGSVEARRTHLTVETRLIGQAELVIEERPLNRAEITQVTSSGNGGGQQ